MMFFPSFKLIKSITGNFVCGTNSREVAPLISNIFLANSMAANCKPKEIPKNGMLFSLICSMAINFPSIPSLPKAPGIITPSIPFNFFLY